MKVVRVVVDGPGTLPRPVFFDLAERPVTGQVLVSMILAR